MTELLDIALSFPTVVFTVLLLPVVALWALTLVGLVDLELFDAVDGALDGSVDGALEGTFDGAFEGAGAIDGAVDGAVDGAADAAAEGAMEGALDGADGGGDVALGLQLVQALGVGTVPLSVLLGFSVLSAWVISALVSGLVSGSWLLSAGVLLVALVGGIVSGSVAARPLAPLYAKNPAKRRLHFVGETCTLTTGRVDGGFGQAAVDDGGAGLLVQVRCDDPENALGRGDAALIVSFDQAREAFVVTPLSSKE